MTTLTVYDPPQCCATGVCGADVDQQLVDFAADLDWLKSQGAEIRRINLSREPMEFVSNPAIKALMDTAGADALPAILVEGAVISTARYPARRELAKWAGLGEIAGIDAPAGDTGAASGGCCGGSAREETETEAASGCC